MEVKIGMQQVAREVVLDVDLSEETVMSTVSSAMATGTSFTLTDTKKKTVAFNGKLVAYVEVGSDTPQKVGFGLG